MSDRPKGIGGFRRRKRGATRRDLQTMEVAPAEWAEIPVSEFGTRVWGEGLEPEEEAEPRAEAPAAEPEKARTEERAIPAPLLNLEDRITAEIHERMGDLAAERRVILDGVRKALVSLGEAFNRRMDEVLAREAPPTGGQAAEDLIREIPLLTEAISAQRDELRRRVDEVVGDLGAQVQAIAQELGKEIQGLSTSLEILSASDGDTKPMVAAELDSLRTAHAESTRRIEALTEVVEAIREAVSRPDEGGQLERVARGVEALQAKLSSAADGRRLDQLTMAFEALQARMTSPREGQRIDRLTEAVAAVQARLDSPPEDPRFDKLTTAIEGLRAKLDSPPEDARIDRVTEAVAAVQARLDSPPEDPRFDKLTTAIEGIRARLDSSPEDDGRLDRLAEAVAAVRARLDSSPEYDGRLDRLAEAVAAVQAGLDLSGDDSRFEELTTAIEGLRAKLDSPPEDARIDRVTEAVAAVQARLDSPPEDPRIDRLTAAIEGLRAVLQAGLGGKADLKDLRAAVNAQRRQEKATADLRERIATLSKALEAFGKPRTAPRLSVDLKVLERRIEAVERAIPRKLSSALDRRITPLQETLQNGIEEVRAELRPLQDLVKAFQASRRRSTAQSSPAPARKPATQPTAPAPAEPPVAAEPPLQPTPTTPPSGSPSPRRGLFRRGRR